MRLPFYRPEITELVRCSLCKEEQASDEFLSASERHYVSICQNCRRLRKMKSIINLKGAKDGN